MYYYMILISHGNVLIGFVKTSVNHLSKKKKKIQMTCTHALVVLTEKWGKIGSKTQNCMLEFQRTYKGLQHISQENFNKMSQWWKLQFIFVSCLWETPTHWGSKSFWIRTYLTPLQFHKLFSKHLVFITTKNFKVQVFSECHMNLKNLLHTVHAPL